MFNESRKMRLIDKSYWNFGRFGMASGVVVVILWAIAVNSFWPSDSEKFRLVFDCLTIPVLVFFFMLLNSMFFLANKNVKNPKKRSIFVKLMFFACIGTVVLILLDLYCSTYCYVDYSFSIKR
jgi:hypothetical protein